VQRKRERERSCEGGAGVGRGEEAWGGGKRRVTAWRGVACCSLHTRAHAHAHRIRFGSGVALTNRLP